MIPVLQSRWRLEGQYLMNYGLRQPLQPAPQRSWQTVSMHRKEQCEQLPGRDLRRHCPRRRLRQIGGLQPGKCPFQPLGHPSAGTGRRKIHSMSPSPLLRFFPSIRFPHKYVKPPGGRLHSQVLFDLIDGVFLQPGHLSLGDPHLRRHLHLSLALKKAEV